MHTYQKHNLFIVILVTLLLIGSALSWYYAYFSKKEIKNNEINESLYEKVTDEKVINDLYNTIINNSLLLLSNNEEAIDNPDKIDMQTKINLAYYSVKDNISNIYEEGIDVPLMEEYFKTTFKDVIYWDKNDIYCTCNEKLFIFDVENNKYHYNTLHMPHGAINVFPYYTKINEVIKKDDIYVVKISNVWNSINESFGYITTGYPTYKDALNNTKKLFDLSNYNDTLYKYDYYAKKEIDDNYDLYKDSLKTYSYTFIKKDNKYYLVSFE